MRSAAVEQDDRLLALRVRLSDSVYQLLRDDDILAGPA